MRILEDAINILKEAKREAINTKLVDQVKKLKCKEDRDIKFTEIKKQFHEAREEINKVANQWIDDIKRIQAKDLEEIKKQEDRFSLSIIEMNREEK